MLKDSINVKGHVLFEQYDKDNNLVFALNVDNLVVSSGKDYIASRMIGTSKPIISHMAIGSGTTFQLLANTTLQTELARVSFDSTQLTNNVILYQATFLPTIGTGAITEAGMFNASTSGDMLCRTTFAPINKGAADTIIITWTILVN